MTLNVLTVAIWLFAAGAHASAETDLDGPRELTAERFLVEMAAIWSGDDAEALKWSEARYTDLVNYYGKKVPFWTVYLDKVHFVKRWPVRHYAVRPGSVHAHCEADTCKVDGIVDWVCENPGRRARAAGVATAHYILVMRAGTTPLIEGEDSDVVIQR